MAGAPILVVDDAPVNLKLMRLLLTHAGYEVRTAESAEDALQMLSNYRPELILADIQLPGMNGLEMTRQVKKNPRTNAIKVVALTACAMTEDRERAMSAGCDEYISKPIDTASLASRVQKLLARPAAQPPVPLAPPPPPAAHPDTETLRRRFLEDGASTTRRLLESLHAGFDAAGAASQFHQWIGSASLLGHPEISSLARQGEELLREEPLDLYRLRVFLTDLALTFTEQPDEPAPVPEYVADAAAGKRVALIGFTTGRADALCTMLNRVKARPRLFDLSDDPASEAIRDCDLVLFHIRPETLDSSWLQPGRAFPASTRLVFLGEQRHLVALPPVVRSRAMDFIVGSAEPQEILMRVTFAVSRDLAEAPKPEPAAAVISDAPVRPRTAIACPHVVLADDDGIIHALVGATLQNHGMSCKSVTNGHDAISMIRSERPHAAVLDVNMPGMDGYQVLAAIRAEKIPTRVILLTSLGHEKDILRAFNLGADDYLTKPFNPFELVARLKRLLQ